jgi:hypothetical protein
MFSQTTPLAAGTKSTVPMRSFAGKKKVEQARPRSRIVGKDEPRDYYRDLLALPDARVLVGYRGRYVTSPSGLQVRAGPDLAVQAELSDAAGPFSLRDGLVLASGPLHGGYQSCVHKIDLASLAILDTFPVREPYLWLPGSARRFVGVTPKFTEFEQSPHVEPALLNRHPHLRKWAEDRTTRLLLVEPDGAVSAMLDASQVGPEYPEFKHLALSADGATLYAATERSVAAVSLSDWLIRWRVRLGDNTGPGFFSVYGMALSGDSRLAVGGLAGYGDVTRMLTVLDAGTGKPTPMGQGLGHVLGKTSIRSLAWHPSGWLAAGTASGWVAHVDRKGQLRTYKGAGKAVESLLFIDEGRSLLVCGTEKQFRVWPLLADETNCGG